MANALAAGDLDQYELDKSHQDGKELVIALHNIKAYSEVKIENTRLENNDYQTLTIEETTAVVITRIMMKHKNLSVWTIESRLRQELWKINHPEDFEIVYPIVWEYFKEYRQYLINLPNLENNFVSEWVLSVEELESKKSQIPDIKKRVEELLELRYIRGYTHSYLHEEDWVS